MHDLAKLGTLTIELSGPVVITVDRMPRGDARQVLANIAAARHFVAFAGPQGQEYLLDAYKVTAAQWEQDT